jgi:hypothetical protein
MALEWIIYRDHTPTAELVYDLLLGACIDEDDRIRPEVVSGLLAAYNALNEESGEQCSFTESDSYDFMWRGYCSELPDADPNNCGFMWPEQMPPGLNYPVRLLVLAGKIQGQHEKAISRELRRMVEEEQA